MSSYLTGTGHANTAENNFDFLSGSGRKSSEATTNKRKPLLLVTPVIIPRSRTRQNDEETEEDNE